MPVRRREPVMLNPRATKYSARHDYGIDDSISRVGYLSNACLDDTYDAANRSRGRDNELMRNVNAAIPSRLSRDITPTRTGRQTKRFQSLPPVDILSSPKSTALVPYRNLDKIKSALSSSPSPSSLLSSRINSYLRGSSVPPQPLPRDIASNISYKSRLHRPTPSDIRSNVSYRSYLSDPSVSSPFSTRSTTKFSHGYQPLALTASNRSSSPYVSRYDTSNNDDYDYAASDDEDYDPDSYKRRYKIVRSPAGSRYSRGVERIGQPKYTTDSPAASDDEDDYYDASDSVGTYTCARPSGTSPLKLSSYDGSYDGTYAADMAEMYDYVPFGPSRQGILELTQEDDNSLPSPSTSHLTSPGLSSLPELSSKKSSTPSSLSIVPHVPSYTKHLDDSLTQPSNNHMLDSLLSSTAARARQVLRDSNLPEYKNASLVLSVEGSAVSDDGKNRYGFRYYPPPIPLKGSHIGLDERIMGIAPKPVSPADSFLCTYLNRLRDIRTDIRDHVDRGDYARGRSVVPSSTYTPSSTYKPYVHRTVDMPVNISGRQHSVPVSSYRSRLDDGQSHRVDVFPLVESETTLDRKVHLPLHRAGGDRSGSPNTLTVLDKINIKAAIIGSRMEGASEGRKRKGPRSQFAANKLRELKIGEIERKYK